MRGVAIIALSLLVTPALSAEDIVPHTVRSLRDAGGTFIELIGPGRMLVQDKVVHYRRGKFIRSRHIDSLSEVDGRADLCILHYATEDYSDNITVQQGCKAVIGVISHAEAPPPADKMKMELPGLVEELIGEK